ncbi:MAG: chlorophyll synthesis pathway protein BchC [Luminiphilus sp.]
MTQSATAVVFESPGNLSLREVFLPDCDPSDCLVEIEYSGVSTGTERLLWNGNMPPFPGLSYPLVPGYESVGRVLVAGPRAGIQPGTRVFVPGSRGFEGVQGLFGGAAKRLVVNADRLISLDDGVAEEGVLLALVATAVHAIKRFGDEGLPQLIVGHGVLGRLIARVALHMGANDLVVWEQNEARRQTTSDYRVIAPEEDAGKYQRVCDVSGDAKILDQIFPHLETRGTAVLAGFYHGNVEFAFPPAFMSEANVCIAAEWQPEDLAVATTLLLERAIDLEDLITHRFLAHDAAPAYQTAFTDPSCLKLILDWRTL